KCGTQVYNFQTATYCAAQDARAAMRFIHANAATYGIDTGFLCIGGESAGAITALHAAFWDQKEANSFASWAVGQVGTLDTTGNSLRDTFHIKGVINSSGAISKDSAILNNGSIPIVSFHDENDCIVPAGLGQVISCLCKP